MHALRATAKGGDTAVAAAGGGRGVSGRWWEGGCGPWCGRKRSYVRTRRGRILYILSCSK